MIQISTNPKSKECHEMMPQKCKEAKKRHKQTSYYLSKEQGTFVKVGNTPELLTFVDDIKKGIIENLRSKIIGLFTTCRISISYCYFVASILFNV